MLLFVAHDSAGVEAYSDVTAEGTQALGYYVPQQIYAAVQKLPVLAIRDMQLPLAVKLRAAQE